MKVAKAQFTGKNWKTNEDTCWDLDTWEQRDHEPIRGYLNDASEDSRKRVEGWEGIILRWRATENQSEKTLELLQMGEKNLREHESSREGTRFRGKTLLLSSNVENDDKKHHHKLWRYSGMKIRKVEPTMKRIWKIL